MVYRWQHVDFPRRAQRHLTYVLRGGENRRGRTLAHPSHHYLPLLSPIIVLNTILALIGHIQVFETPLVFASANGSVATGSNPLGHHNSLGTFLTYLYLRAFVYNDFGYGSAIAVIIFLITLLLTLLVLWTSKRFTYYAGDLLIGVSRSQRSNRPSGRCAAGSRPTADPSGEMSRTPAR